MPYDRSVATAIGHGKKAARCISAYVQGESYEPAEKPELANASFMHTDFYTKQDRKVRDQLGFPMRTDTFDEVIQGFTPEEAKHEASRCFSCGNCFECDTCYKVCPVDAISKLGKGKGYSIDYDICIRCGLCAKKCPCGAMKMVD